MMDYRISVRLGGSELPYISPKMSHSTQAMFQHSATVIKILKQNISFLFRLGNLLIGDNNLYVAHPSWYFPKHNLQTHHPKIARIILCHITVYTN